MWGAAIWGGSCCHCGWGHNNVNINVNNNFNRNTNINAGGGGGGNWQHNPQHRGGTPYADKATAGKYGGSARGDSMSSRQASARQQGGSRSSAPSAGGMDRSAGAARKQVGCSERGRNGSLDGRRGRWTFECAERLQPRWERRRRQDRKPQHSVEQRTQRQRLRGQLERVQRFERPVGKLTGRLQHGFERWRLQGRRRTSEVRR